MDRSPRIPQSKVNIETLLGCGCFQGLVFACFQICNFVVASNMIFMAFGKYMPPTWSCLDDPGISIDPVANSTVFNTSMQCEMINMGCKNFTFDGVFYSIVPQWQLVCSRVKYIYVILTSQMVGTLLGPVVFGQLSDLYGRKWTLISSTAMLIIFGAASAFSTSWQMYAVMRFIIGFFLAGSLVMKYVYLSEFVIKKHRFWTQSVGGWIISYAIFLTIAYVTADWRQLSIIPSILAIPALFAIWWTGESPRWLIEKGNLADAEQQLRRISKWNRLPLDEDELSIVLHGRTATTVPDIMDTSVTNEITDAALVPKSEPPPMATKKYTYWHLFSRRSLAIYVIVMCLQCFSVTIFMYGISFNLDRLDGNLYANFAILFCSRLITIPVAIADLKIKKFGRRTALLINISGIFLCSVVVIIAQLLGPNLPAVKKVVLAMSLLISMFSVPATNIDVLVIAELFPTPIRNLAISFCATFGRFGQLVLAPILYWAHYWPSAPYAVFVFLSLLCMISLICIPETKGRLLPDKMPARLKSNMAGFLGGLARLRRLSRAD